MIPVYRYTPVEDEYGDDQMPPVDQWPLAFTIDGRHAPSNPNEGVEPGRNTVIAGGIVYSRDPAARNVKHTDAVGIDGVRYQVDGKVGDWGVGVQFAVKAVS